MTGILSFLAHIQKTRKIGSTITQITQGEDYEPNT